MLCFNIFFPWPDMDYDTNFELLHSYPWYVLIVRKVLPLVVVPFKIFKSSDSKTIVLESLFNNVAAYSLQLIKTRPRDKCLAVNCTSFFRTTFLRKPPLGDYFWILWMPQTNLKKLFASGPWVGKIFRIRVVRNFFLQNYDSSWSLN